MVEELKMKYNYILNRYYNGCNYVIEHPEECDKYIKNIKGFKEELDILITKIEKIEKASKGEILGGFKIC